MRQSVLFVKDGWQYPIATGVVTKIVTGSRIEELSYDLMTLRKVTLSKNAVVYLLQGGTLSSLFDQVVTTGIKNTGVTMLVFSSVPDLTILPVHIQHLALAVVQRVSDVDRNKIFMKEFISS